MIVETNRPLNVNVKERAKERPIRFQLAFFRGIFFTKCQPIYIYARVTDLISLRTLGPTSTRCLAARLCHEQADMISMVSGQNTTS
jgi:hypothetical protein